MEKLSTIQKYRKLNTVYRADEKGPGGAYHQYCIALSNIDEKDDIILIQMQKGARENPNSIHGATNEDLLEIVRDRLRCFQEGPFSCRENENALKCVEEALMWLNYRFEDRLERNVLGKDEK